MSAPMLAAGGLRRFAAEWWGLVAVVVGLAGCDPGANKPAEPVWGKQPCEHCAMLVSARESAAQCTSSEGRRFFFDDVGCLVNFLTQRNFEPKGAWVRGPGGTGWVTVGAAKFASGAVTPMDSGFVAATEGVSFEEVRRVVLEKSQRQRERSP